MADFKLANPSIVEKFSTDFTREYVRASGYLPYMGTGEGNIIRWRNDLVGKGSIVHVPFVARLKGTGVTGAATLKGQEENLANYSVQVKTTLWRHGVIVTEDQEYLSEIDFLNAAKPALRDLAAEKLRDDITAEMDKIVVLGTVVDSTPGEDVLKTYANASAGERNAFITLNADRVLFGASKSNNTNTMSTSLANVDSTTDKMSAGIVRLAKSMAKTAGTSAGTRIRPYKTEDGREYFVLFVDSNGFRDLEADTTIAQANRDARERGLNNPIFQSGDLLWNGVIIREIVEKTAIAGVGASSINVGTAHLCGLDALVGAYTQKPAFKVDVDDYDHRNGVAIREIRGLAKTSQGGYQNMVTIYHASVADA